MGIESYLDSAAFGIVTRNRQNQRSQQRERLYTPISGANSPVSGEWWATLPQPNFAPKLVTEGWAVRTKPQAPRPLHC